MGQQSENELEQRRLAEALAASEARYRHLVESAPDIIYRTDRNGNFTFVNATAERIIGRSLQELVGTSYLDLIHPDDRAAMRRHYGRQWVRGTPTTYAEFRVDTPGRIERWIGQNVQLLVEGGHRVGFQAIARDITDRKLAQESLARLQRQTESILNSAAEGILSVDARGRITLANPSAAELTGFAIAEMLGQPAHQLFHHSRPDGSPYPAAECALSVSLANGSFNRRQTDVFWKHDGSSFPVEYTIVPLFDSRRIAGAVITFHDISERMEMERMKDDLISLMSHELRTPLTSLRASLGLLTSGVVDTGSEQGQRLVALAGANTDRLIRLVGDILDMEHITKGTLDLEHQRVAIRDVVERAVNSVRALPEADRIQIVQDLADAYVIGDIARLAQAVANLLDNAIKFSPDGGRVELSSSVEEGEVRIQVRDYGPGIPEERLQSIFNRFEQLETSPTGRGGTGLGLTICRRLIEMHGGRVWAKSTVGCGATFCIALPAAQPVLR